jgi:hypothetical protein
MILLIILSFGCIGAWSFILYTSFSLKGKIASISSQADSAQARDAHTLSLKSALRESRDSVTLINSRFITKDGIPAFIDLLEVKADALGLTVNLDSINLDQNLHIHITGSGSWKSAVSYVSTLEALPYAVSLDNLMLSKIDGSGTRWNIGLDLTTLVDSNQKSQ